MTINPASLPTVPPVTQDALPQQVTVGELPVGAVQKVGDYKIHASRREGPGMVEIHARDTDIAYVIHGSATLVTGGTAVGVKETAAEELRGTAIQGGETRQLEVGDVVVIPNGVPHWFREVRAPFLYYVVKVRQAGRQAAAAGAP